VDGVSCQCFSLRVTGAHQPEATLTPASPCSSATHEGSERVAAANVPPLLLPVAAPHAVSLQEVQDLGSAELGLTLYQLATTYYAHDMLVDAGPVLQRATQLMRNHYPEDHDLVRHAVVTHAVVTHAVVTHAVATHGVVAYDAQGQCCCNSARGTGHMLLSRSLEWPVAGCTRACGCVYGIQLLHVNALVVYVLWCMWCCAADGAV
jgi:hypothetical protein